MDLKEKKLYHQVHLLKLATDIGVTPISLYFLWQHRLGPALLAGFIPPTLVSAAMMRWSPGLERIKSSPLGAYLRRHMTPAIELLRLSTLVPMGYGAWAHQPALMALGVVVLVMAWAGGVCRRP